MKLQLCRGYRDKHGGGRLCLRTIFFFLGISSLWLVMESNHLYRRKIRAPDYSMSKHHMSADVVTIIGIQDIDIVSEEMDR